VIAGAMLVAQIAPGSTRPFSVVTPTDVPGRIAIARQASLTELRARLNARVAERERDSGARARRLRTEIQQAGGIERYLERSRANAIERVRRAEMAGGQGPELKDPQLHLAAINDALTHIKLCNKPWVWKQSEIKEKYYPTYGPDTQAYKLEYAVTPGNIVFLSGCHFGTVPGKVDLRLKTTGQVIHLQTQHSSAYWYDYLVAVYFPRGITGVPDQQAELLISDSNNQVSDPMTVDFFAERDVQRMDTFAHQQLVTVSESCFTAATDDQCGGTTATGNPIFPGAAGFLGKHHKQCCNPVTSTDSFYIKLRNGWEIADPDRNPYDPPRTYSGFVRPFFLLSDHGYTTCAFFNDEGRVEGVKVFKPADPTLAVQIDVTWHVDWACSGILYLADLFIMGPKATNYWW
jgi:hypothetical protein